MMLTWANGSFFQIVLIVHLQNSGVSIHIFVKWCNWLIMFLNFALNMWQEFWEKLRIEPPLKRECARLLAKYKCRKSKKNSIPPYFEGTYYGRWNTMLKEVSEYWHNDWLMHSRVQDLPKSFTMNWKQMDRINIGKELHLELDFLWVLCNTEHCDDWSLPIAQSVEHIPHFTMYTDASLDGLEAICRELRFLMRIFVPQDLVRCATKHISKGANLININDPTILAWRIQTRRFWNMTKTTPHNGPPRSSTSTGDPHNTPPYKNRRHVITKVINQQSVTIWFYKIVILHGNNNDSRKHFLTIERLLDVEITYSTFVNIKFSVKYCM